MKNLKLSIQDIELNVFYPEAEAEPTRQELMDIVENRLEKYHRLPIERMEMNFDSECVDVKCVFYPTPFNRIRRITGYLVSDMSKFNNAKLSEVKDRKTHISMSVADTLRLRDSDADGLSDFIDNDGYTRPSDIYYKQISPDAYERILKTNKDLLKECHSTPDGDFILRIPSEQKNELENILKQTVKPSPLQNINTKNN